MGLDSVELLTRFENYFKVDVPDAVSENLYTVGDTAVWFSRQLGLAGRQSAVRATLTAQLLAELLAGTTEATPLSQVWPDAQALDAYRYALRNRSGLVVSPLAAPPATPAALSLWERLTGRQLPRPPHWHTQTLAELIDWTLAANYEQLLVPPLASQYEVTQAVIGITSHSSGVPVEEIRPQSRFVDDLGMD